MTVMVAGMLRPGTIEWDLNKVPHIIAQSDHDAIFLQGWVHTQDRFFQMDNLRRTFSGTLAELLGRLPCPRISSFARWVCGGQRKSRSVSSPGLVSTGSKLTPME